MESGGLLQLAKSNRRCAIILRTGAVGVVALATFALALLAGRNQQAATVDIATGFPTVAPQPMTVLRPALKPGSADSTWKTEIAHKSSRHQSRLASAGL
jgi:hypothetical protein